MNISKHVQFGNKKLPKTTMIFNCGAASDCPSRRLGLCQAGCKCYALKAEIQYPQVRPYRARQREILTRYSGDEIATAFESGLARKRTPVTTFRFNEAGDFEGQADVDKMTEICTRMGQAGLVCYGYTARTDLDLSGLLQVAGVNVSNDNGGWVERGANRFRMVSEHSRGAARCAGDCRKCSLCHKAKGREIEVMEH